VSDDADVSRVLAIVAHPDDVDFAAAGTVAQWTARGMAVTYAIVTDGGAGGASSGIGRERMAAVRRREQRAAAAATGVHDVRFLGYRDGELTITHDLRRDLCRLIRQVRPERMLIQSPERNWDRIKTSHPDHLAAGEAAMQAIYPDARNPRAHAALLDDEGLSPWTVSEAWLMGSPRPTVTIDITEVLDVKLAAVREHASQTTAMGDLRDVLEVRGRRAAREAGLPEGRLGEAFAVVATA
jgi:LmbE family N-acetylglucosaminyl deacetylase